MIDRARWQRRLVDGSDPGWPCPRCKHGSLKFGKDHLAEGPTASGRIAVAESDDHGNYEGRFACILVCNVSECQERVTVGGEGYWVEENPGRWEEGYTEYVPRFVYPSPDLIDVPNKCPEYIQIQVRESFKLFWCDRGACLNRIRAAVEDLLTDMRIRQYCAPNGKKKKRLTLHDRIDLLQKKKPFLESLCENMRAVKWLGKKKNEGSHGEEPSKETVFDAFDILERILHSLYDDSLRQVTRTVATINKRRGSGRKPRS